MRSDYPLYAIAIICFVITAVVYFAPLAEVTELYIYGLVVLGIVFIGLGYMARPKTPISTHTPITPTLSEERTKPVKESATAKDEVKVAPAKTQAESTKASTKKPVTRRTRKRTTRSKKKT